MTEQSCSNSRGNEPADAELDELMLRQRMSRIGRKLLVLSGKGGVGKSTVAVNLAIALARAGKKVGLLDVDLHGPSVPKLLGLDNRKLEPSSDGMIPIIVNENLAVMSVAFVLPNNHDPIIWRGPLKHSVIRQFLKDVTWGRLDYLVIDSPPGTGDEPLSVAQLAGDSAVAIIVTTPQDLSISDVRRCIAFCEALSLPVVGVVENMSGYLCPKCGQRTDLFKAGGGKALAEELGLSLLGQIPIDPRVVASGDAGSPFACDEASQSPASEAFEAVVGGILASSQSSDSTTEDNERKENRSMKIAIPLANGRLCMHFGHCEQFALVDTDEQNNIVNTALLTPPAHEPGVLPAWLGEQGVDVIIAGGMGQRAQQLFTQNSITVVAGAPADEPEKLVSAYLAGTLEAGENACDH